MREIPTAVQEALKRLREGSKESLEIRVIKNGYYVYKVKNIWDRSRKKQVKKGEYFGRIEDSGIFKPVRMRKPRMRVHSAQKPASSSNELQLRYIRMHAASEKYEIPILTALSMNARMPMKALGELVGLSETAVKHQVNNLEKKYGIRYIPDIDVRKLGYLQFFITVKFLNGMPPIDELKKALESVPQVQLAFLTKGDVDLMIYALAKDIEDLAYLINKVRENNLYYESEWNTVSIFEDYGLIPIRDEFFEVLKERVWKRTKENPRMQTGQLKQRFFFVLRELNKNGAEEFSRIAGKLHLTEQDARYEYLRLKDEGIIRRSTISMNRLPIKYIGIIMENVINYKQFRANRPTSLSDIIETTAKPADKYNMIYDINNPNGSMFFVPVIDGDELQRYVENINNLNLGAMSTTLIVTDVLVGGFCFRKFDNAYSVQQKILEEEYGHEKAKRIDYEQGKNKKVSYKTDIRGLPLESIK